ncbi:hypothetical protein MMC14_002527 [Varicellaria rhodocarpa]|nr:hypothetical protein [Varicellaria rhodocarpa]
MHFYLLALLPLVAAQFQNSTVHNVDVGKGGLIFSPNSLTANVGDKVQFTYYPQNHSVAQSSFGTPCAPLSTDAIFSGFMPVANGTSSQVFTITINTTTPLWLYCSQGKHCQNGMAMVINQATTGNATGNSIAAYINAAKGVVNNVSPAAIQGGAISAASSAPNSTSGTGTGSTTTGTTTSTSSTASSTSSGTSSGYVVKSIDWTTMSVASAAALIFGGLLM